MPPFSVTKLPPRRIDWIVQGITSHQTHYRSYRGRFLRVKWPNSVKALKKDKF